MGTAENQATKVAYTEVESDHTDEIRLKCHCGHVIKKRRDAFAPGLHTVICLACSNVSCEVVLATGEHVETTDADHASAA